MAAAALTPTIHSHSLLRAHSLRGAPGLSRSPLAPRVLRWPRALDGGGCPAEGPWRGRRPHAPGSRGGPASSGPRRSWGQTRSQVLAATPSHLRPHCGPEHKQRLHAFAPALDLAWYSTAQRLCHVEASRRRPSAEPCHSHFHQKPKLCLRVRILSDVRVFCQVQPPGRRGRTARSSSYHLPASIT